MKNQKITPPIFIKKQSKNGKLIFSVFFILISFILTMSTLYLLRHYLKKNKVITSVNMVPRLENTVKDAINIFKDGVGLIKCYDVKWKIAAFGSASLWNIGDKKYVLTNYHVTEGVLCYFKSRDLDVFLPAVPSFQWNQQADIMAYSLDNIQKREHPIYQGNLNESIINHTELTVDPNELLIDSSNEYMFRFSPKDLCGDKESLSSKVYIMGYPSFAQQEVSKDIKGYNVPINSDRPIWWILPAARRAGIMGIYETLFTKAKGQYRLIRPKGRKNIFAGEQV